MNVQMPIANLFFQNLEAGKAEMAGTGDPFQQLLDRVINASKPAEKPSGKQPEKAGKSEKVEQKQQPDQSQVEEQPDAALAAQAGQSVEEQPQAETAVESAGKVQPVQQRVQLLQQQVQPMVEQLVVPAPDSTQPMSPIVTLQAAEQPQQTSDVPLVIQTATGTPDIQVEAQSVPAAQPQDRFGEMLAQATQELQARVEIPVASVEVPQTELAQNESSVPAETVELPAKPVETVEVPSPVKLEAPQPKMRAEVAKSQVRMATQPDQVKEAPAPVRKLSQTDDEAVIAPDAQKAPEPVRVETSRVEQPQQNPQDRVSQMEQVHQKLMEHLSQLDKGRSEFVMQLQPQELGKVSVKMVLENGRLAVEIVAASPKAAELLSRQTEGLVQSLRLQLIEVDTVHVVTESETASGQMYGAFNMMNGQAEGGGQSSQGNAVNHTGISGGRDAQVDGVDEDQSASAKLPETLLDYAI